MASGLKGWLYMHHEATATEKIDSDYVLDITIKMGPTNPRVNVSIADNMLIVKKKPSLTECMFRIKFLSIGQLGVFAANRAFYFVYCIDCRHCPRICLYSRQRPMRKWPSGSKY